MTFEKFLLAVVEATKPNQSLYTQIGKLREVYAEFELKEAINKATNEKLFEAIKETLEENRNLADGDKCTLWRLKQAIGR